VNLCIDILHFVSGLECFLFQQGRLIPQDNTDISFVCVETVIMKSGNMRPRYKFTIQNHDKLVLNGFICMFCWWVRHFGIHQSYFYDHPIDLLLRSRLLLDQVDNKDIKETGLRGKINETRVKTFKIHSPWHGHWADLQMLVQIGVRQGCQVFPTMSGWIWWPQ
jgi:hypothetical protein